MSLPARLTLTVLSLALIVTGALWSRAQAQPSGLAYLPQISQPDHPSATAGPSATATVTTTATATQVPPPAIEINDVVCREPTDDPTFEYIELVNTSRPKINLTGWKIINTSQGNATFTFPAFTVEAGPNIYVVVYGGIGAPRPDIGEFYWGNNTQIWHIGDKVEVRDALNRLVTSLTVPADSCS